MVGYILNNMDDKELIGYIERSIIDIARKCNVKAETVIKTFITKWNKN